MYDSRNGMAAAELKYEVILFLATSSFISYLQNNFHVLYILSITSHLQKVL